MKTTGYLAISLLMALVAPAKVFAAEVPRARQQALAKALLEARDAYLGTERLKPIPGMRWWYVHGPARSEGLDDHPKKVMEAAKDPGAKANKKIFKRVNAPDGTLRFRTRWPHEPAAYLCAPFKGSPGDVFDLDLGFDGGLAVWFNDKQVMSEPQVSRAEPKHLRLEQAKENLLLIKLQLATAEGVPNFELDVSSGNNSVIYLVRPAEEQFPELGRMTSIAGSHMYNWLMAEENAREETRLLDTFTRELGELGKTLSAAYRAAERSAESGALAVVSAGTKRLAVDDLRRLAAYAKPDRLKLAIDDMVRTYGDRYVNGAKWSAEAAEFASRQDAITEGLAAGKPEALGDAEAILQLQRTALLANPALDFDRLLVVLRDPTNIGLPANWQGNSSLKGEFDNEIAVLDCRNPATPPKPLYRPGPGNFVGDVDLHFDAERLLFSSKSENGSWQVFEVGVDGTGLRQVTPTDEYADVDNYDPMYLADDRIIFDSSSGFQGVPCVGGNDYVANLHIMNADGTGIRRLCFEQDNDWCPVMLPNGRVMYLRWEYTDSAHYFSRVLMHMNPDGTGQTEYYGSNSYWPNALFYARPLPGSSTKFVAIVSGHHGVKRAGELHLFDTAKGRHEAGGAIQQIPGYGEPVIARTVDGLVGRSWPRFLHPYPLTDKHFLVSCQFSSRDRWGLYLVDIYDNFVLLREDPRYAVLEPVPLRKRTRPPVIPDRVSLNVKEATVLIQNIYEGAGLKGVPRGAVKNVRLYQYVYGYRKYGGHYVVGMESGWDVRRILGTAPVNPDGSASFRIPANTPVSIQPLDAEGKALQIMRSWFVAMPGESVQCVGCHEPQNQAVPTQSFMAAKQTPQHLKPWYGPVRGFSFLREVQPVLERHCVGCHDGREGRPNFKDTSVSSGFVSSYLALHPYTRRNGPEGDYEQLTPLEFHADTSDLVQMLQKGHHRVTLDAEGWDRLITWIDLNVPCWGAWSESGSSKFSEEKAQRRKQLRELYAGVSEDVEDLQYTVGFDTSFVAPPADETAAVAPPQVPGWPMDVPTAARRQQELGRVEQALDLGDAISLTLKRVPAGEFVMGSGAESPAEGPLFKAMISAPFWIGETEVSVAQYRQFDPDHQNGYYDMHAKDQVNRGYNMDVDNDLPAIRISWHRALEFCEWLSARTGKRVSLPTETQWEWACRAGSATPLFFGTPRDDFGRYMNCADLKTKELAVRGVNPKPIPDPPPLVDFFPKDDRYSDGILHLAKVNTFEPNAWGLRSVHGNVAEWTLSKFRPYPASGSGTASDPGAAGRKVVRGGSWHDRPKRCTSSFRLAYPSWQRVYNVGFRVVVASDSLLTTNQ